MSEAKEHRLVGLEPDNLLAFLALLGLLRALERSRPNWRPRACWDIDHPPTRPVLLLSEPVSPAVVAEAAAQGCTQLAEDYSFGEWRVPNGPKDEATRLLTESIKAGPARRSRADLLSALFSDIAARAKDLSVIPTPLCLLFGQGHQYFLERLATIPREESSPPRGRGKKAVRLTPAETIAEALFERWKRIDASEGFRWDPAEDRRYALRFGDPSKDTLLTVHGANRLAAIGLPVLTVAPVSVRGNPRPQMIGARQKAGQIEISWPIWTKPASLAGIRALLSHPMLHEDQPDRSRLEVFSIQEVRRATRISVGKFLNFTPAVSV